MSMSKPRILDLFCGDGGAAMGYARAGFEVVGVDIKPRPHYPFEFHQADALAYSLDGFDAIHASPPCQLFSRARLVGTKKKTDTAPLNLIPQTRALLVASGRPYVIENVPHAPLLDPITLCGSSFGLKVRRHRLFESNVPLVGLPCDHKAQGRPVGVYHTMNDQVQGTSRTTGKYVYGGRTAATLAEGQAAMGIDWMPWSSLILSIPPAYTEHIGRQVMAALR